MDLWLKEILPVANPWVDIVFLAKDLRLILLTPKFVPGGTLDAWFPSPKFPEQWRVRLTTS